ncbi:MAG: ATP-dependent Clp protease proteolytic subunit [Candidatus Saganbacteria bacterium]|nr:ATP-dependent Clp protease proteolytic subunit [Candidatus Saganbacteria bacterium]
MSESGQKIIYVNYYDTISDVKVKAVMAICAELIANQKPDVLYVLFSSSGGLVDAGITLYNYLRALPVEIVMHNMGSIDSIANVIFLAADRRYACQHSSFLFHGIVQPFNANTNFNSNQLTEIVGQLEGGQSKISGIITTRTLISNEEIFRMFNQGETKDPAFALSKGVIQEIRDPSIPKDVPVFSLNLPNS